MRHKPDIFVSPKGVTLAKYVGQTQPDFNLVVTSDLKRAEQTALHMGHRVDKKLHDLGSIPSAIIKYVGWPVSFKRIAEVIAEGGVVAEFAELQAASWRSVLNQMPDSQNTLIVTHGLMIELGMVACFPNAQHQEWGNAIGYCEGMLLTYTGTKFLHCELLRVPESKYLVKN